MRARVILTLLAALLASPASPANEPIKTDDNDVQHVVILTPSRPILVRLHVQIDGKPIQRQWHAFFKHLFELVDADKDGKLSATERKRIPSPTLLFPPLAMQPSFYSSGSLPTSTPPPVAQKNQPFALKDLIAYFKESGAAPLRSAGGTTRDGQSSSIETLSFYGAGLAPSAEKVSEAFTTMLDRDGDGKLSAKELGDAETSLLKRDFNEDEILTLHESLGDLTGGDPYLRFIDSPRSYYPMGGMKMSQGHRLFVVENGMPSDELAKVMLRTYLPSKSQIRARALNPEWFGFSKAQFATLDKNRNNRLERRELARFAMGEPDVELTCDLGKKPNVALTETQRAESDCDRIAAWSMGIQVQKEKDVDLGFVTLRFTAATTPEYRGFTYNAQYHANVFKSADRDGNGYVDVNEARRNGSYANAFDLIDADKDKKLFLKEVQAHFKKWGELFARAQSATATVSLFEQGFGYFSLLDTNDDNRISVREMRRAASLLKRYDKNKDGHLSRGELPLGYHFSVAKGASRNAAFWHPKPLPGMPGGPPLPTPKQQSPASPLWHRKMDLNHDGDVSAREFLGSQKAFATMDTDGDRLVSAQEARNADARLRPIK